MRPTRLVVLVDELLGGVVATIVTWGRAADQALGRERSLAVEVGFLVEGRVERLMAGLAGANGFVALALVVIGHRAS